MFTTDLSITAVWSGRSAKSRQNLLWQRK